MIELSLQFGETLMHLQASLKLSLFVKNKAVTK